MATPNASTRKKQLEKMRAGDILYTEDKDAVRGLLTDLRPSEALIVIGTHSKDKVNLRMGDISYGGTAM